MDETILLKIQKQCKDDSDRWFPQSANDLSVMTLGLCGETGEFADVLKKVARKSAEFPEVYESLKEELADVFIYLMNIAEILKMDMLGEYMKKRDKNVARFENGQH
jgi:NTP pyrophosphatase (non-canonical NTP hydrolase)